MNSKQVFYLLIFLSVFIFPFSGSAAESDLDPTFAVGSGVNGTVIAMALQVDGKIVIGGNFDVVGGVRRNKIARLNPDGSLDTTFTNGSGIDGNGIVQSVAVQTDGKVLVGGEFFSVNGTPRSYFVRFNADGSLDPAFNPQISDRVLSIDVQPDGKILIAGDFMSVNNSFSSRRLARLNADGSQDMSFVYSLWIDLYPSVIQLQTDGKILVGGNNRIARLNTDGSFDGFNAGQIGLSGFPQSIGYNAADQKILIGGSITSYNGVARSNLIKVSADGTLDTNFNPVFTGNISGGSVSASIFQPDGKILIAGFFDSVNGVARNGLARLNTDGTLDVTFAPTVPFAGGVTKILLQPDGKIAVGGQFTSIAGAARNRVARLNENGTIDSTFSRKRGAEQSINSLLPLADGKILIGGFFSSVDETPRGGIARLNANGLLDASFNPGSGFDGAVAKLALQPDGKIIAAGFFTNYNGTSRSSIARLNADASLDSSFDPGSNFNAIITDLEIQPDGKIIVVGLFSNVGGIAGRNIARLNVDGSLDASFNPGSGADCAILSLASQPDGRIVVAGAFNSVNGAQRNHIARLNLNGAEDSTFLLTGGFSGDEIYKVALQPDGKIVVGGTFLSLGNFNRGRIARLLANGAVEAEFNVGGVSGGANNEAEVNDIVIQPNGKILFAGDFTVVNSVESIRIARLIGTFVAPAHKSPFDYDGDGKTDLSIFRPAPGEWWIQRSSDNSNFAAQFGVSTDKIVPADYTGDGKTDFAFFRPSSGQWFILRSEDFSFYAFPFGTSSDTPVPADYDGDGKADAAVFRASNLTWYINKSSGGTEIIGFGATGDKPVVADYDGDGKADIAIFRPNGANGAEWWIRRSSNGSVFALQFGTASDKPVQGDFTGDGKSDIALFRPSNGNWFILRSEDFSFYAFPFGANGDIPVAGDYDGDGKFDAGVFRPSNSNWFIQRSTAGTLIQQFGISGDLPTPNAFVP